MATDSLLSLPLNLEVFSDAPNHRHFLRNVSSNSVFLDAPDDLEPESHSDASLVSDGEAPRSSKKTKEVHVAASQGNSTAAKMNGTAVSDIEDEGSDNLTMLGSEGSFLADLTPVSSHCDLASCSLGPSLGSSDTNPSSSSNLARCPSSLSVASTAQDTPRAHQTPASPATSEAARSAHSGGGNKRRPRTNSQTMISAAPFQMAVDSSLPVQARPPRATVFRIKPQAKPQSASGFHHVTTLTNSSSADKLTESPGMTRGSFSNDLRRVGSTESFQQGRSVQPRGMQRTISTSRSSETGRRLPSSSSSSSSSSNNHGPRNRTASITSASFAPPVSDQHPARMHRSNSSTSVIGEKLSRAGAASQKVLKPNLKAPKMSTRANAEAPFSEDAASTIVRRAVPAARTIAPSPAPPRSPPAQRLSRSISTANVTRPATASAAVSATAAQSKGSVRGTAAFLGGARQPSLAVAAAHKGNNNNINSLASKAASLFGMRTKTEKRGLFGKADKGPKGAVPAAKSGAKEESNERKEQLEATGALTESEPVEGNSALKAHEVFELGLDEGTGDKAVLFDLLMTAGEPKGKAEISSNESIVDGRSAEMEPRKAKAFGDLALAAEHAKAASGLEKMEAKATPKEAAAETTERKMEVPDISTFAARRVTRTFPTNNEGGVRAGGLMGPARGVRPVGQIPTITPNLPRGPPPARPQTGCGGKANSLKSAEGRVGAAKAPWHEFGRTPTFQMRPSTSHGAGLTQQGPMGRAPRAQEGSTSPATFALKTQGRPMLFGFGVGGKQSNADAKANGAARTPSTPGDSPFFGVRGKPVQSMPDLESSALDGSLSPSPSSYQGPSSPSMSDASMTLRTWGKPMGPSASVEREDGRGRLGRWLTGRGG